MGDCTDFGGTATWMILLRLGVLCVLKFVEFVGANTVDDVESSELYHIDADSSAGNIGVATAQVLSYTGCSEMLRSVHKIRSSVLLGIEL